MSCKTICHLTSVHTRYDTRIFLKECRSLAKSGYKVSLIVADGKGDEIKDNVSIFDVGSSKGRLKRIFKTTQQIYKKAIYLNADTYHFHDPELIPVGLKLKTYGKKVIYDMHEDLPKQIMLKPYIWLPLRKIISYAFNIFQNNAIKKFDALLVPQPTMYEVFRKHTKTYLIENFSFTSDIDLNEIENRDNKALTIFHAGGLTSERGVFNMLELACCLDDNDKFYLAGQIQSGILEEAKLHPGWNKIKYLGELSHEEVKNVYLESNLGVILYNNVGQYGLSYAIKLFEYMSYGIPVIMPDFGEWVSFNKNNKCGVNVDVSNIVSLREAVALLKSDSKLTIKFGVNGYNKFSKKYCWNRVELNLLNVYKDLCDAT